METIYKLLLHSFLYQLLIVPVYLILAIPYFVYMHLKSNTSTFILIVVINAVNNLPMLIFSDRFKKIHKFVCITFIVSIHFPVHKTDRIHYKG